MSSAWRVVGIWIIAALAASAASAQGGDDALQTALGRLMACRTANQQALVETLAPEFSPTLRALRAARTPGDYRRARDLAAALCLRDDLTVLRLYAFLLQHQAAAGAGCDRAELDRLARSGINAARVLQLRHPQAKWLPASMMYGLQLVDRLSQPTASDVAVAVHFSQVMQPWLQGDPVEGFLGQTTTRLLLASIERKAGRPDEALVYLQEVEKTVAAGEVAPYHALQARLERARILLDSKAPRRQVDPLLDEVARHPLTDHETRAQAYALLARRE